MESIEAERAAESGSALGSLTSAARPSRPPPSRRCARPPSSTSRRRSRRRPRSRSDRIADERRRHRGRRVEPPPERGADRAAEPDAVRGRVEPRSSPSDGARAVRSSRRGAAATRARRAGGARAPVEAAAEAAGETRGEQPPCTTPTPRTTSCPSTGEDTAEVPHRRARARARAGSRGRRPRPRPPRAARRAAGAPSRTAPRERSLVPRMLAAAPWSLALAAVGVYFLLGSGSEQRPSGGQFQARGAPVSFTLPERSRRRASPRSGGLLKPTFSTAVGVDARQLRRRRDLPDLRRRAGRTAPPSAPAAAASRPTASTSRSTAPPSASQRRRSSRPRARSQPGKAGDLIARVYTYTRPGGSSARYAFAFRGHTEYSIACFWDPAHAEAMSAACEQVMTTLQRRVAVPTAQSAQKTGVSR